MDCKEAERLVQPYIENKLPSKKLEAFISHVQKCPSCYEELETYFIIHHAIKYLDEDRHDSYNMKEKLSVDLGKKRRQIRTNKHLRVLGVYLIVLLVILIAALIGMFLSMDVSMAHLFEHMV